LTISCLEEKSREDIILLLKMAGVTAKARVLTDCRPQRSIVAAIDDNRMAMETTISNEFLMARG
jgi:hypothetical protein